MGTIKIEKGMTEWQVLEKFCNGRYGKSPRMTGAGFALMDFIAQARIKNGKMPKDPVAVTTIVSTDMADAVAKSYGIEMRRVLTGFKYIGDQIASLEAAGHPERYIFGFEESYGYLSGCLLYTSRCV